MPNPNPPASASAEQAQPISDELIQAIDEYFQEEAIVEPEELSNHHYSL